MGPFNNSVSDKSRTKKIIICNCIYTNISLGARIISCLINLGLTCLVLKSSAAAAQTEQASFLKVIRMQELEINSNLDQAPRDITIYSKQNRIVKLRVKSSMQICRPKSIL
jgi:hypothetical protein